jgi:hypothetical protein
MNSIRVLNSEGLRQFREYYGRLKAGVNEPPPLQILSAPDSSTEFIAEIQIEPRSFPTKLEAARYLHSLLGQLDQAHIIKNTGLWAWISLYYFEQLVPLKSGKRSPKEIVKIIPDFTDHRKYYRHLLAMPYRLYWQYGEKSQILLTAALEIHTDLMEQIGGYQDLISSHAILEVAERLYAKRGEDGSLSLKRGAGGKGAGSPRRLADVMRQFDLTYDIFGMERNSLIELAPQEFERLLRR